MPRLLQALIVVSWTSAAVVAPAAAETFLVKDGKPHAEIVIADNPPRSVRFAAEELQTYVEKISGARLEVVTSPTGAVPVPIYVGESEAGRRAGGTAQRLGRDAFRMVSGADWLALVGSDVEFVPIEPWGEITVNGRRKKRRNGKNWPASRG